MLKSLSRDQEQLLNLYKTTDVLTNEHSSDWNKFAHLLLRLKPLDLVEIDFYYPETMNVSAYVVACVSEFIMFETAYLWAVTGKPPYTQAIEFGLAEKDIEEYQNKWRSIGIEPLDYIDD